MNALTVTSLSGPQHPPKVDGLGGNEIKEIVSMKAGLSRPAHPPKVSAEPIINTFMCDALTSNGNELYESPVTKGGLTLTQTVMARQKLSLILLVNSKAS